jgi:predicted transcriptional regulator
MTRILADLPDDDIKWLDQLAAEQGKSRASVLREAVESYRAEASTDWLEAGFGLWLRHGIAVDPAEYERKRRAEWTRPWDDDYEEVRAESPEMFTEDDDRERAHYLKLARKSGARRKKSAA